MLNDYSWYAVITQMRKDRRSLSTKDEDENNITIHTFSRRVFFFFLLPVPRYNFKMNTLNTYNCTHIPYLFKFIFQFSNDRTFL